MFCTTKTLHMFKKLTPVILGCLIIGSSAKAQDVIHDLNVYPNPATDFIYVDFESDTCGIIVIDVNDLSGRVPVQINTEVVEGFNHLEVDLTRVPESEYFLGITTEKTEEGDLILVGR